MTQKLPIIDSDFLSKGHEQYLRHLSLDCVIFGFHENALKVLLLKWKDNGPWCLPGGFIKKDESLDDAAVNVLRERTGLHDIFLQQFRAFGNVDREKNKQTLMGPSLGDAGSPQGGWLEERFVTIGYYALVDYSRVTPMPDLHSEECRWWDVHQVPSMLYDHNDIFHAALGALKLRILERPVGMNLLPSKFTMPELQSLYETILDKKLDRRNFQKKVLSLGILQRQKETRKGGAHKAPFLYKFNNKTYQKAMKAGFPL
jgi:8-oxo-dGTP diphosphatase